MNTSAAVLATRALAAVKLMFLGDSLAMPVHWFYDVRDIAKAFPPNGVSKLESAPSFHPSSIMNLHSTSQGGRSSAISGKRSKEIVGEVILKGKRHLWGQRNQHYHTGMRAGENTLNLHCARVLMRTLITKNGYDQDRVLDDYITFMTSDPPLYKDTYAESYHRGFFANLEEARPRNKCGAVTHDTPSIGGLVSIGPLALSLLLKAKDNDEKTLREIQSTCRSHLFLTHPDAELAKTCDQYVSLISALLFRSGDVKAASILTSFADKLFGPRTLQGLNKKSDVGVIGGTYSPACYIDGAWPGVVFMAQRYAEKGQALEGLLSNANLGGDNCHRGAVLGFILGLSLETESSQSALKMFDELVDADAIADEVAGLSKMFLGASSSDETQPSASRKEETAKDEKQSSATCSVL